MYGKKADTRFTIRLRHNDPQHQQVAEILNSLGYHGKAQYIVDAVLHYANTEKTMQDSQKPRSALDENAIEAIINRLLDGRDDIGMNRVAPDSEKHNTVLSAEEINFADALEALGGDGFCAISDALEMFMSK